MAIIDITTYKLKPEEWRPVVRYESLYTVSSSGRVRRKDAHKTLKQCVHSNGYAYVTLCQHGKRRTLTVHKMVALAFLGPCENGLTVNHKNGQKPDNHWRNLEYATQGENNNHARSLGLMKGHGLTAEQVREIRETYAAVPTITFVKLAIPYGVTANAVRDVVRWKSHALVF